MIRLLVKHRLGKLLRLVPVLLCAIGLCSWEVALGSSSSGEDVSMEFVIAGIINNESLLQDVRARFTLDSHLITGTKAHQELFEIWKGDMVFRTLTTEVDGKIIEPGITFAFDGKQTTVGRPRANARSWMDVKQGNTLEPLFTPRRLCWDFTSDKDEMRRLRLSKLLSEGDFSLKEELFEERISYVIEGTYQGKYYRFHIDPQRGFMVVKVESGKSDDEISSIHDEVELKEVAANVWFPMKARWRVLLSHPLAGSIMKLNVTSVEVNKNISDDELEFELKSGDLVYDEVSGTQIEVP